MGTSSGPSPATFVRLAFIGVGTDRLRIALSAIGSAIAAVLVLSAANVLLIGAPGPREIDRYQSELLDQQGLHPGVIITLLGLTIPLIAFVGQCIRIGAPARDRRLASLRMAGATGRDVARIVVIETGLAAGGGAVVGALAFAIGRTLVPNEPNQWGALRFPTDIAIPLAVYGAIVAGIGALACGAAFLALRRTIIDPFGVSHRHETTAPATFPVVMLTVGILALVFFTGLIELLGFDRDGAGALIVVAFVALLACGIGLTFGAAALAQRAGRATRSATSKASLLIAGSRLEASPYRSSRNLAAVLLAVMIGAGVQQVRVGFLIATDPSETFYADTFNLLDFAVATAVVFAIAGLLIAAAEGITERRRTLAALVAMGTPRRTLARSIVAETMVPLVPGVIVAAVTGTLAARGFVGSRVEPAYIYTDATASLIDDEARELVWVPVPWLELAVLCGGAVLASLIVTAGALFLLPASVSTTELRAAA